MVNRPMPVKMRTHIPYIDYSLVSDDLKKAILTEIGRIIRFKNVGEHEEYVAGVERSLAEYFQTKFAIAVDSGTTALQLSLTAIGVREGDEVIVPTYTYVATALAVTNLGARPVFIDVKKDDLTIDPGLIEPKVTPKTKAVIPVHIHGLCCDMDKIRKICEKRKIALIEDASQAHGASIDGKKVGSFGIGCFSLHTSKNLGGIGDAGLIVLNDNDLYNKIRRFLVPDSRTTDALLSRRTPCTMDAMQAAIIKHKLCFLDIMNQRKRDIAGQYDVLISNPDIKKPVVLNGSLPAYRDYFIVSDQRDTIKRNLAEEGIETKLGYSPLHLWETFEKYSNGHKGFEVSESISDKVLLLPSFWGLTDSQLKRVCALLRGSRNARA